MKKYPNELQEVLRLRDVALKEKEEVSLSIESIGFGDHYTFAARGYHPVSGRLVRVYSYEASPQGILRDSVRDITERCRVEAANAKGVKVLIPCTEQDKGRTACVLAAFRIFTPDVFAPHLLEFQRDILKQYADVPLAGACKDEWGFPGRGRFEINDPWFSPLMAEAYARRRPGHDLVRDLLLMVRGESGLDRERAAAINHTMEMIWQRNGEIESDFYAGVKAVFGPESMVATHPTWWYTLAVNEIQKNGASWWLARRDLAQTDEACQLCIRTALSKKWQSPLWYNMYYAPKFEPYTREIWQDVLAGGRVNFHPFFPCEGWQQGKLTTSLLNGELLHADARIRLLNAISTAPKDCPVAVVFGHSNAMNWAGAGFADYGVKIAEALWGRGFPADLIPSDEIQNGSLVLDSEGWVRYGSQRYAALVLYHPEYDRGSTAEFFRKAATGKTRLFRVGPWTTDFEGRPFDGNANLPAEMTPYDVNQLILHMQTSAIEPQSPPAMKGHCRLLDGTHILISAQKNVTGDVIQETLKLRGQQVQFDAVGVAAVHLGPDGKLEAMAAGGLKSLKAGGLTIDLADRCDVALWRDKNGQWRGILQGVDGPVPEPLTRITKTWTRLTVPTRLGVESARPTTDLEHRHGRDAAQAASSQRRPQ